MTLDLKSRASDDLLIAAHELNKAGVLENQQDVIDFFSKPWHWSEELKSMSIEVNV